MRRVFYCYVIIQCNRTRLSQFACKYTTMLMRSSDKSEWNFRCNEPKHGVLVWIWCILSTSIVGTTRWWGTHGESYSSKISQTSIEESFPRAPGTRSRSSACFHVVVGSFRSRPRFRERASFSPLFRQIMHINSLFLVVHLCELVQKREAFSRPTCSGRW